MKKLDKYLHKWFLDNYDLDIQFYEAGSFGQDTLEGSVSYSFNEITPYDDIFRKVCIGITPAAKQFDDFILSLFHEVGHIVSDEDWPDRTWVSYMNFINKVPNTKEGYMKYYNHPIEYEATATGMEMIKDNIEGVRELQKVIKEL